MTKTAHTPGPWHTDVSDQGYIIGHGSYVAVFDDTGRTLSHIFCTDRKGVDRPYQANARLIAAAPDLLDDHVRIDDALTFALENGDMPANVRHSVTCARDIARAAIAKAKGGAE